ncbi:sensor histidine kinase [Dyadobacter sp. CY345]|uniref:sensor histidine kinase n=1 Tax=Dyadobacter sp. CY345 TaxID=2909335 RepID=UPI001F1CCE37|nr:sensor histidine kinase [Dyadobacter sp. CY345]
MNLKLHFWASIQLVLRSVGLVTLFVVNANAQSNTSGYSDVARQRLLIRITAQYLHTISQGQIDMDSAVRIPCKVYGLSPILAYSEGYSDGRPSPGTSLIDAGKIKESKELLTRLKDSARIRLLIELGSYYVFMPGNRKADLDQAAKYIDEAINFSRSAPTQWKIESMTLRAHLLHQSGRADEGQKMFTEIETLCERSGNTLALAQAFLRGGEVLRYGDPIRLSKFEKALSIFKTKHLKEQEIETLSLINIENFVNKRYDVAEALLHKIIKLQTEIKFRQTQYPYDALSWLAYRKGALNNALTFSNKSLASINTRSDSTFIGLFYTRRGLVYERLFKSDEAITWFDKSLKDKKRESRMYWYRSLIGKVGTLNVIGRAKEALPLLKEAETKYPPTSYFEQMHFALLLGITYENLKRLDLAEQNYNIFLIMAEKFPMEYVHDEFPAAFFQIAAFYRKVGNTAKARELLEQGKEFISATDISGKGEYFYNLYKLDSLDGRYLDAIKNLNLRNDFKDSVFSYDQRKKANELLVKYEAEKKDKDIRLLNSQNQLQRIKAEEADRTKNITLAGAASLLIIIGLLLNRYSLKQRSNRQLEANQKELDRKNVYLETLNTEQEKLLKEKEWLIREVHHRVKNNLQMVTSLLNSQSAYLEDDAAVTAVQDSLRRMQAMSLIHQKLYLDENTSQIAMPEYISELVGYLQESFDTDNRINYDLRIEPLYLDVSQAIPLGLIINESIVNAIKYAFLNEHSGLVCINLKREGADYLFLKISDNGIGLPAELDLMQHNSLGLDLMQGLTKQLKGSFTIESLKGVHITVRFPVLVR